MEEREHRYLAGRGLCLDGGGLRAEAWALVRLPLPWKPRTCAQNE